MFDGNVSGVPGTGLPCKILIVDDEVDVLAEYEECARALGYACIATPDPARALQIMAEDPTVGILVTDLDLPMLDGVTLLDEIVARFSRQRPIVSLVITGHASLELVVASMRHDARDFLPKPVSAEQLAAALRRASRIWREQSLARQVESRPHQPAPGGDAANGEAAAVPAAEAGMGDELLSVVRSIMDMQQRRKSFLDPQLFSDPSWDILLELTAAKCEGKPLPVSSACAATGVPFSTALRYVRQLVDANLVRRWKDTGDRRRDMLELADGAMAAMSDYLWEVTPILAASQGRAASLHAASGTS